MKVGYDGNYVPCRWMPPGSEVDKTTVGNMSLMEFFNSDHMKQFRTNLFSDQPTKACSACAYQDSFGKVSGRSLQLFRSKISLNSFDQDYEKSHHHQMFEYSRDNAGQTTSYPYDLQVNLSNVCNSACIMCGPKSSSRLVQDYHKLAKKSHPMFYYPEKVEYWGEDPALVEKFIGYLKELPSIDYLHLLGGETLYLESFWRICEALIDAEMAEKIYLGTTTNLTLYSERLENIITKFSKFHVGLSIESVNSLNDYIRYPSEITSVMGNLYKFLKLRDRFPEKINLTLRITPNIFSIFYIDELIQFMCDHNITAESTEILFRPACLRIELMPDNLKLIAIDKLKKVIEKNSLSRSRVVDTRNHLLTHSIISSVAYSYLDFLENMVDPADGDKHRYDLVQFLTGFESLRDNSILDYAPDYKDFLIEYGYDINTARSIQ